MKAVILAAGKGTRMQQSTTAAPLDEAQRRAAELGLKGLIPIQGRPFLDYVISAVARAGVTDICLVVGPGAHPVRTHYEQHAVTRLRIHFAVQDEPRGGAHALLAAQSFAGDDAVLVLNSDNFYPASVLRDLTNESGSALAGFTPELLVERGNIPRERLAAFAVVSADAAGNLIDITEKPGADAIAAVSGRNDRWISMTCWRFRPPIFAACRAIAPSARGEYELPDAVRYARQQLGETFRVVRAHEPVLDLTTRADIAAVERALHDTEVML